MRDQPVILTLDGKRMVMVHRRVVDGIAKWVERGPLSREAGGILLDS